MPGETKAPARLALWLPSAVGLVLLCAAIVFAPRMAPVGVLEGWLGDVRVALLAPPAPPHPAIAIVKIDSATLAKLGRRSPIDRLFLAKLIATIADAKPRAIGVDVLFDQPSEPAKDAALVAALHGIRVPVVLAWAEAATARGAIEPWQEAHLDKFLHAIDNKLVRPGLAYLPQDADGVIRRLRLASAGRATTETLPVLLAQAAGATVPKGREIPLAYYGHPTARSQPFNIVTAQLIDATNPAIWAFQKRIFAGRVVLIGADLPDTDRYRTPFAADLLSGPPSTPGVVILAHATAQLLDGRRVAPVAPWMRWGLAILVALVGFAVGSGEMHGLVRAGLAVVAIAALCAADGAAYAYGGPLVGAAAGPLLPLAAPAAGLLAALGLGIAHTRRKFGDEKRFIHGVLSRYVSPKIVGYLLAHPEELKLGGERREMTFLFTDIAGFTSLCEVAEPTQLVALLNEYLGGISSIVHKHEGTLDKFIGDAVVAFWGAPLAEPDHAAAALRCALDMDRFAQAFRARAEAQGLAFGLTRIGLHSGVATVGNFGGADRIEYTAMGDVVNTASRLEGANKYLGTRIAVSGETARRASDIRLRPSAELVVAGRREAVPVFEPADGLDAAAYEAYLRAYDMLRRGESGAEAAFAELCGAHPSDPLAALHLGRLRRGETGVTMILEGK